MVLSALRADTENGKIVFAYASAEAVKAGTMLAVLNFSYDAAYLDTSLTVRTLERGTALNLHEETTYPVQHESGDAHDYQITKSVAPTCTEDGYDVYTCTKCGDSYQETRKALGHAWSEWSIDEPATCTETGKQSRSCSRCGETETQTIPVDPNACPSKRFDDLDTTQWYHEGTDFVLRTGLMRGTGEKTFAPNDNLTRGQLVTVLYRMAGSPSAASAAPFTDVEPNAYYADAVA
jgi:DNA-directed RNA polymerase subunit RPC12/RpoP